MSFRAIRFFTCMKFVSGQELLVSKIILSIPVIFVNLDRLLKVENPSLDMGGRGFTHVQGPKKFACQNDAVLSLLPEVESTSVRPKGNPYVFTWFCSKLPASLHGRQDIRCGSFLSPRFWQREFFRPLDNGKS